MTLKWGKDSASIEGPRGFRIDMEVQGGSAYLDEDDAETLREMRRAARRTSASLALATPSGIGLAVRAVQKMTLEEHRKGGHQHFRADCPECLHAAGRMRSHWRLAPETRPGGSLSCDVSGPHCSCKFPSGLQEHRAKRVRYFLVGAFCAFTAEEEGLRGARQDEAKLALEDGEKPFDTVAEGSAKTAVTSLLTLQGADVVRGLPSASFDDHKGYQLPAEECYQNFDFTSLFES